MIDFHESHSNNFFEIQYYAESFPGLFFRPNIKNKKIGWPTIILFSNSSFVLIGGKKINLIYKTEKYIKNLISSI